MAETQPGQQTAPHSGNSSASVPETVPSVDFVFHFDTTQLEAAWQQVAAQVEGTLSISDEQDPEREAAHWDQIEKWLLKGYQRQAKSLALKVARLEFMMQAMTSNLEAGLSQSFTAWRQHFDASLSDMVNRSIAQQVEKLVTIEVAQHTQVIANLVRQQVQAQMNEIITAQVGAKTTNLAGEITTSVLGQVQAHVGTLVESQVQNVQHQVAATVMKDVTQLITKIVSESLAAQTFDLDMASINRRINHALQLIAKLEADLYVRINHGDTQLYNWTLKELLSIKGCVTDREVLVEQLTAFTSALQGKLEGSRCVDTRGIAAWEGLAVVPVDTGGAGALSNGHTGAGGTATPTGGIAEAQEGRDGPDDGLKQLLAEMRAYLTQHPGVQTATALATGLHHSEEQVQKALAELQAQGELGEWHGSYGPPATVAALRATGDAALAYLKGQAGLQTAAEVAQGLGQSEDQVQGALNVLLGSGEVVSEHGRYGTPEEVAAWQQQLAEITKQLKQSDGLQTAAEMAKAVGKPLDTVQQALDQLEEEDRIDDDNGRYGTPEQVQAAKELAKRLGDRLVLTKGLDTVADLAQAVSEPEAKVQNALDQLKAQGEVSDWNGRYGTVAEVNQLRQLGTAIIDHLKTAPGLQSAAEVAEALQQPAAQVQQALDQLKAQGQVGERNGSYGLPETIDALNQLGNEIVSHLKQSGLESASELAKTLNQPVAQVQAALDQLKAQGEVDAWHGRYDTPDAVAAVRTLNRVLDQLPKTQGLDTAASLAQSMGVSEKQVQGALDELKAQGAVKDWKSRYGTPEEVDKQIALYKQVPVVMTLAGGDKAAYADGRGAEARFYYPRDVVVDAAGVVYVADAYNHRIRKISPDGIVTTLAGSGSGAYADGRGAAASFYDPHGVAVDTAGVLYVADYYNHRIRKIGPDGVVTTLAGSGNHAYADGRGAAASFNSPQGVAVDAAGVLYVTDYHNHRIRKISPDGVVTTLAGSGRAAYADGRGAAASFCGPWGIAVDAAGVLYVADLSNHRIRKISPDGVVTTLAGSGKAAYADGRGAAANFHTPTGVAVDAAGVLYVADANNNRIRKITPEGDVTTLAGSGSRAYADGRGAAASFSAPFGVAVDADGVLYVADYGNHRIRKIVPGNSSTGRQDDGATPLRDAIRDYVKADPGVHTAGELAPHLHATEAEVKQALDELEGQGELGEWHGSYGPPATVSTMRATGDAALAYLKGHAGLQTAAEVAKGLGQSEDQVQGALNVLLGSGEVVSDHGRYGTPDEVAAWQQQLAEITDHLKQSDGLQTAAEVAKAVGQPLDTVQQALDQLEEENRIDDDNGRYGTPEQVQAAKELAKRLGDRLVLTKGLDTVADLAQAVSEPEAKVQNALDQLKTQGEVSDWNGRYGTVAEVNQLRQLGTAIIDHLKTAPGLQSAAEVAEALQQPAALVQQALDQLQAQGQVGEQNSSYGLPETIDALNQLGNEIVSHLKQSGLQSASELAKTLNQPVAQVQAALDQLKAQGEVDDWHGRYDTPEAVAAVRELGTKILDQLPKTTTLDTAATLAQALGVSEKHVQGALDELKAQNAVKDWKGRYGTPSEVDKQIALYNQIPVVMTLAGSGSGAYVNGRGAAASFHHPIGVAADATGVVYVAEQSNHRIRKITPEGLVTTLAGSGRATYADGRGAAASFYHPSGVAVDADGVLYVADALNYRIRKITPEGLVTTLAGSGTRAYADGRGAAASFEHPHDVAVDADGVLYVADAYNNRIRKITPEGDVTTLAGSGTRAYADGRGAAASFNTPYGVAVDADGVLYVADYYNYRIRKITPEGDVTTLAGSGTRTYADGRGAAASFRSPYGVAVDADGVLYVADTDSHRIRKITPDGLVTTFADSGNYLNVARTKSQSLLEPHDIRLRGHQASARASRSSFL